MGAREGVWGWSEKGVLVRSGKLLKLALAGLLPPFPPPWKLFNAVFHMGLGVRLPIP